MKPTLVLVGRTNVGKSTLFNRLTRSRDAIVADVPGLTRDRQFGHGRVGIKPFLVVDTGGFEPAAKDGISAQMTKQTQQAIAEGDEVLFMVDARQGLQASDRLIAESLRKSGRPVWLVVNKAEGMARDVAAAEFFELGLGVPLPISAAHGEGVSELIELALANLAPARAPEVKCKHPKIAIVGRPNAGKSTLVNSLLGEERVIVFGEPGTTRDSIYIEFEHNDKSYTLIDTAGLRKRGKAHELVGTRGRQNLIRLNRIRVSKAAFNYVQRRIVEKTGELRACFYRVTLKYTRRHIPAWVLQRVDQVIAKGKSTLNDQTQADEAFIEFGVAAPGVNSNARITAKIQGAVEQSKIILLEKIKKVLAGYKYDWETGRVFKSQAEVEDAA